MAFTNSYIAPPSPPDQNEDVPGHSKQAVRDGNNGVYDLSLSVTGGVKSDGEEGTPINVLFVLDTSGSMDYSLGNGEGGERQTAANDAIKEFVDQLSPAAGFDARFALVKFSSNASKTNFGSRQNPIYWTDNGSNLTGALPTWSNGGTGYTNALKEAKATLEKLDAGRRDDPTVMIFLSDGDPDEDPYYMDSVYSTLQGITNIDYFYTVGVGPVENYTTLKSLKDHAAEGVVKDHFNGNSTTELANAFAAIKKEVTYRAYSNVSIEDTLTGNVDVVMDDTDQDGVSMPSDFWIIVSNNEGTPNTVGTQTAVVRESKVGEDAKEYFVYTTTVTIDNTGTENKLNPKSYTLTATYTTAHDKEAAKLTLDFDDDYNLENGWTYAVHIDIQASEAAKQAYINAGYSYLDANGNLISGAGTAVPGTGTHGNSQDVGFYSNTRATLTYTNQDNIRRYVEYDHPVIQLKTVPVTVTKTFSGLGTVTPPDGFTISVKDGSNKTLELKKGTNAGTTWTWQLNLLAGNYTVTESSYAVTSQTAKKNLSTVTASGLEGSAPTVPVNSSTPIDLGTLKVSGSEANKSVSITNTYVDAAGNLKIIKNLDKLNPLKGETASFVFQVTNTTTNETYHCVLTFTAEDKQKNFTFRDLPAGTYTVKELNASGYTVKCDSAFNADGTDNDTISNNVATVNVSGIGTATVTFNNNSSGNKPGDNDYAYNQFTYEGGNWVWNRNDDVAVGSNTPAAG